jgi:anti-sigma factor RsiW
MDPSELLDYVLGRLVGPRRERLERRMDRDPALAEQVARLIRNLGRLLDDGRGNPVAGNASPSPELPPPDPSFSSRSERPDIRPPPEP